MEALVVPFEKGGTAVHLIKETRMSGIATAEDSTGILPTEKRNFNRGQTELEPMRGHDIGTEPGILYQVKYDLELDGIIAVKLADDPLRPKTRAS